MVDLKKLGNELRAAQRFRLSPVDLCIIAEVMNAGGITIMALYPKLSFGSSRTVRRRVDRMVRAGVLVRTVSLDDRRAKPLVQGPKLKRVLLALAAANI
jgi:DNA-binding MarR family transcriptional regulator